MSNTFTVAVLHRTVAAKTPKVTAASVGTDLLTIDEANLLASLLSITSDEYLLHRTLVTVGNKAAFTCNQDILRQAGCLQRLSTLLKSYRLAVAAGHQTNVECLQSALTALNNLAMNESNQQFLAECIPLLIAFVISCRHSAVQIASLEALTNLTVLPTYHSQLVPYVSSVIDVANQSTEVKLTLQSLRLLANLTLSPDVINRILQDEDLSCFLDILDKSSDPDIILRLLTCLRNIHSAVRKRSTAVPGLQPADVNSSQSDLLNIANTDFDADYLQRLDEKLRCLNGHPDDNIQDATSRLLQLLP